MKNLFTMILLVAALGISVVNAQQTRSYSADDMGVLLTDLETAVDGDVFTLTTSGGVYKIDSMSLEVHADITITAAPGLEAKPMIKMVQNEFTSVDYLVRLKGEDVSLTLNGLELQGDSVKTKYAIRTAKIGDLTDFGGYDDPAYDGSVVQWYDLSIMNCDINGITSGSDGRGIIMYPGTRARLVNIQYSTFSAIERDGINAYADTDDLNARGHWVFAEMMNIENSTFHHVGREAIQIRSADTSEVSGMNKLYLNHVTFDSCAWNNADPGKYHTLKIDYVEATIMNCIFSNDISDDYITRIYNPKSTADFLGFYNLAGVDPETGLPDPEIIIGKTFKVDNGAVLGENVTEADPMYADALNGDYTLGADSPFLAIGSDGSALGDLRWDASKVSISNADLSSITVDGTDVADFDPAKIDYTVELPFGTVEVPEVLATTYSPDATYRMVSATTIPGTAEIIVTAEDMLTTKTYAVYMYEAEDGDTVSVAQELIEIGSVYPNPSNGMFTIANYEGSDVLIYSITGQVVYRQNSISNEQLIVADLNKGVYFIMVTENNSKKISKIIIE